MTRRLSFLGAAGCVTGSCYLLEIAGGRLLVDCGFFQGYKQLRLRNWAPPPYDPASIDAEACLSQLEPVAIGTHFEPLAGVKVELRIAGHLLGATFVRIEHAGLSLTFSGDLGRSNDLVMKSPDAPRATDYLIVESTYADRLHPAVDPDDELARWLASACARGGVTVIPASTGYSTSWVGASPCRNTANRLIWTARRRDLRPADRVLRMRINPDVRQRRNAIQ